MLAIFLGSSHSSGAEQKQLKTHDVRVEPRFIRPGSTVTVEIEIENVGSVSVRELTLVPAIAGGAEYGEGWYPDNVGASAQLTELAPGERATLAVRIKILQVGAFKVGGLVRSDTASLAPEGKVVRVARPAGIAWQLLGLSGAFFLVVTPLYAIALQAAASLRGVDRARVVGGLCAVCLGLARWVLPESLDRTAAEQGLVLFFVGWTVGFSSLRTSWSLWGSALWSTFSYVSLGCGWVLLERVGIARLAVGSVWSTSSAGDSLRWPLEVAQVVGLTAMR